MTTKLNLNQYAPVNSLSYNCIINGGFTVNQRVYASNAALSAGAYGHDRWKAGSGGGDYTFTQLAQSTTITIKTGKTLIQVIEDKNVIGGTYTLSWTGTAQARFGKDSATPSGAYAASPLTITGQTAGTVMSVEFNEGTLGQVNLANSNVALPFMPKSYEEELRACQRYCIVLSSVDNVYTTFGCGTCVSNNLALIQFHLPVTMRIAATDVAISGVTRLVFDATANDTSALAIERASKITPQLIATATGTPYTVGHGCLLGSSNNTTTTITFNAEL